MDDKNKKTPEYSQNIEPGGFNVPSTCSQSRPDKYQSTITLENLSDDEQGNSGTSKEIRDKAEHVHQYIHKHVHKHRHRHKHKHEHKHKHRHKSKNEHECEYKRERKHRDKQEHKRHGVILISDDGVSVGGALSSYSRSSADIHTTLARHSGGEIQTNNAVQARSPKLEEMQKEIEELNVLIEQHEKQLLSLEAAGQAANNR